MLRIQILDDDPSILELLESLILDALPGAVVTTSRVPAPRPGQDVYILDNRFGRRASEIPAMIRRIRMSEPEAVVLACSATIGESELRELVNAGCAGVADKNRPGELERLTRIVTAYDAERRDAARRESFGDIVRGIRRMLGEWRGHLRSEAARAIEPTTVSIRS